MSKVRYYLFFISVQLVIAIFVYVSLNNVSTDQPVEENVSKTQQQVYWTYEEEKGPLEWVTIDPSYYACGGGYEQSPINIESNRPLESDGLGDIELNYSPTKFLVEDTGHTVELQDPTGKNTLIIDREVYYLRQIHFHLPSEHRLDGQPFNMEGHLVHESTSGKKAVIGFFIKEGKVNTDLAEVWNILTNDVKEQPIELTHTIDLLEVLPEEMSGYQYKGSLTTPPCTEGVTWLLLEQPIEFSSQQIEVFANIYHENNRPIQQINNRKIYEFILD